MTYRSYRTVLEPIATVEPIADSFTQTCENSATNMLKKNLGIIGGVAAAIAVIEVHNTLNTFTAGILSSRCMANLYIDIALPLHPSV